MPRINSAQNFKGLSLATLNWVLKQMIDNTTLTKQYVDNAIKAVLEVQSTLIERTVIFAEGTTQYTATVNGRVIAVFSDNEQIYPQISYSNGVATITASNEDAADTSWVILYTKKVQLLGNDLTELLANYTIAIKANYKTDETTGELVLDLSNSLFLVVNVIDDNIVRLLNGEAYYTNTPINKNEDGTVLINGIIYTQELYEALQNYLNN